MASSSSKSDEPHRIPTREELEADTKRLINVFERWEQPTPKRRYLHEFFKPHIFPSRIAVIWDTGNGNPIFLTYKEVGMVADIVEHNIRKTTESGFIGISSIQNHLLPSIQIGVLRSGCGFVHIDSGSWTKSVQSCRKVLKMRYLILHDNVFLENSKFLLEHIEEQQYIEVVIHGNSEIFRLVKLKEHVPEIDSITPPEPYEYAYAIQTSGSTGKKKMVLVPHYCILPNVDRIMKHAWELHQVGGDVVYGSSPETFDPSIVELFAALGKSGRILYVSKQIKNDGHRLGRIFMEHGVTVLTMTPSVLRSVAVGLKATGYFDLSKTKLRLLALGGESCLSKEELRNLISRPLFTNLRGIINMYGITEMSCWASYSNVDPYDPSPISINGTALPETWVSLARDSENDQYKEICLASSTRLCTVLDEDGKNVTSLVPVKGADGKMWYRLKTGDYGFCDKKLIYCVGRLDRVAKRNGMKVPLNLIEDSAMESKMLRTAECVVWNEKIFLLVVLKEEFSSLLGLGRKVRAKVIPGLKIHLFPMFYPDTIIALHSIPLNDNGKVDMIGLLNYVTDHQYAWTGNYYVNEVTIIETLKSIWLYATQRIETVDDVNILEENFFSAGGSSSAAVWFTENVFLVLNLWGTEAQKEIEDILGRRLPVATFASICHLIACCIAEAPLSAGIGLVSSEAVLAYRSSSRKNLEQQQNLVCCEDSTDHGSSVNDQFISNPLRSMAVSKLGLRTCVDARVSLVAKGQYGGVIIVGSHSGHLMAVDLVQLRYLIDLRDRRVRETSGGAVMWTTALPGRVEAEVVFSKDSSFVYIGCHDRRIYKVSTVDGAVFNSYLCEGAIRSKPSLDDTTGWLAVCDDTRTLYCLDSSSMELKWKQHVVGGLVSSSLPVCSEGQIYLTTLTRGLIALDAKDGSKIWPEYGVDIDSVSSPVIFTDDTNQKQVVIATKNGAQSISFDSGKVLWTFTEKKVWGSSPPYTPELHICRYRKLVEVVITSRTGKVVVIGLDGKKIREITFGNPDVPSTVICTRDIKDKEIYCYTVLKQAERDQFELCRISDGVSKAPDFCSRMNYRLFSVPCTYNEFLIFGARDNNVHIIAFNSLSTNDYAYIRKENKTEFW